MFLLSRRQCHAALAGAAAAVAYLAAAEAGSKRPVRVSGLFVLASVAMAGMAGNVLSANASAKAVITEARLNNILNNGFSSGGNIVTTHALSAQSTTGQSILGSVMGDQDGDSDCPTQGSTYNQANVQAIASRVNNLKAAYNGAIVDLQACVSRVNNFTAALG